MSNDWFQFNKFKIKQEQCAMKVGTDGVLLGAWATMPHTENKVHSKTMCTLPVSHILDIGMGTGLIALMMAQRYPTAVVYAIDIDAGACIQANENVLASPFADRVVVQNVPLQQFTAHIRFDAIVSNPPYFIDSLRNPDDKRQLARHTDSLSYYDLCQHAYRLLSHYGNFSVVLPTNYVDRFVSEATIAGFFLSKQCWVQTCMRKPPKRCLMTFTKVRPTILDVQQCAMQDVTGDKSEWFKRLTKDFLATPIP